MKKEVWINKKTGNYYQILFDNALDTTNVRDCTPVIIYRNQEGQVFVREQSEFLEKFTKK